MVHPIKWLICVVTDGHDPAQSGGHGCTFCGKRLRERKPEDAPPPHLERCPFCGEKQRVTLWEAEVEGRTIWCVFCEACEAEGPHKTTPEVAASGWNVRVA